MAVPYTCGCHVCFGSWSLAPSQVLLRALLSLGLIYGQLDRCGCVKHSPSPMQHFAMAVHFHLTVLCMSSMHEAAPGAQA